MDGEGREERDGVSFSQWSRNVMDRTSRSSIPGITNERRLLVALLFFVEGLFEFSLFLKC